MAGPEFWQTGWGRQFFEGQLPQLIKAVETIAEKLPTAQLKPRFAHECPRCEFAGRLEGYDLYRCMQGGGSVAPTLIARFGDGGADYTSGPTVLIGLGDKLIRLTLDVEAHPMNSPLRPERREILLTTDEAKRLYVMSPLFHAAVTVLTRAPDPWGAVREILVAFAQYDERVLNIVDQLSRVDVRPGGGTTTDSQRRARAGLIPESDWDQKEREAADREGERARAVSGRPKAG